MSRLTLPLFLTIAAALLAASSGMPSSSNIIFPDDAEWLAPRVNRQRSTAHRSHRRPNAGRTFFLPDEEVETSEVEAVTPDIPPSRPAWIFPDQPTPADSAAVIEDKPVPRPSDSRPEWPPHTPEFSPSRPEEEASAEVGIDASTPEVPAEPPIGGSGSNSKVLFSDSDRFPIPSCGGELFFAYDNITGDCRKLWTDSEAGCEPGSWFVVHPDTGDAACRPRFCPIGETLFDDVCWVTSDDYSGACAAGQGVFLDHFGRGFCDCLARQVYWSEERRCYPVYQRGPCPAGEHLVVPEDTRHAVCRPASCPDGEVLWGDAERHVPVRCYSALEWRDNDPCPPGGRLNIDIHTLKVDCKQIELHNAISSPLFFCAPGSHLDVTNNCQTELVQKFRSRFAALPESSAQCTAGYTLTPAGHCVKDSLGGSLGR